MSAKKKTFKPKSGSRSKSSPTASNFQPKRRLWMAVLALILVAGGVFLLSSRVNLNPMRQTGQALDSLDGVVVFHNGGTGQVHGRNMTADGYNLGLKYQCVEFVKRYYWQHYSHKMPEAYGHAKDFFDRGTAHGELNKQRGLLQFENGGTDRPQKGDLLVFGPTWMNKYGHVAIVSKVEGKSLEVIQQNAGPFGRTRARFVLSGDAGTRIDDKNVLGWLRMPEPA